MSPATRHHAPWLLWPFAAIWDLLALALGLTGRLLAAIIGFALMVAGIVCTVTVIGAPLGIPLIILGFLLMLRSLF